MALKDLTVVILSRGREEILRKTLSYWSNKEVRVLVLHNSVDPLSNNDIPRNVQYVVQTISYGQRCGYAAKYLNTKYAILSADDEVLLPSALEDFVDTLEHDGDLVSIGGSVIAIGKYGPRTTGTHCYHNMNGYVNRENTALERLTEHFDVNKPWRGGAMYRVMKSDTFLEMMKLFSLISSFSTPYIYEVSGEIFINSAGKSKYVHELYWIRNWINEPVRHKNWNRNLYFSSWFTNSENEGEVSAWREILQPLLRINSEEFDQIMHKVFELRFKSESREVERNKAFRLSIPSSIKYKIRRLTKSKAMPKDYLETLTEMHEKGIKIFMHELEEGVFALTS
jgi:glycosyltransferase domain-containing protein